MICDPVLDPIRDPVRYPIRDPVRYPIHDPIQSDLIRSDPIRSRFCRRRKLEVILSRLRSF